MYTFVHTSPFLRHLLNTSFQNCARRYSADLSHRSSVLDICVLLSYVSPFTLRPSTGPDETG